MVPPESSNYIWRFFRRLTDPVLVATGFITPRFIGPFLLPLVGVFWLTVLRVGLLILLFAVGLAPQISSAPRSEEHTSELQSLMRTSYAAFCLKKKNKTQQ